MYQETILIVDDEPTNLGVLLEALEKVGFKVLVATQGEYALQALAHVRPDLILLDIMMPGMNGFETCERLKTDAATREIPVIFMTALTDTVDEVHGLALGAVDYITKPFQVETVLARIRTHLTVRQMQQSLEQKNTQLQQEIIERKRTEEALAEERNLLRTVIDQLPDYIFVKDTASRLMLSNIAHAGSLGAAGSEEVFGETDVDKFPQEFAARASANEQAIIQSGEPLLDYEETTRLPDGRTQWLLTTKVPLRNRQGTIIGVVGISHDITERKAFEETLRKYERIVSATADYIALVDREYRYQFVNAAYLAASSKDSAEIVGQPLSALIGVEAFETTSRPYLDRCLTGETVHYETWLTLPKPGRRFLSVTYSPYVDADGAITGVVLSAQDITQLQQIQEELQESEERYRRLVELSPNAIIVHQGGRFVYVNAATCKLLRAAHAEDLTGKSIWEVIHPAYHPLARERLRQNDEEGKPVGLIEMQYVRLDGQVIDVEVASAPIIYRGAAGMQTVFKDITERKLMEQVLRESEQRLLDIINFLPDATLVIDQDGRVMAWNKAMEALTGVPAENMLGKGRYEYALPFYGERRPILIDLVNSPHAEIERNYVWLTRQDNVLGGEVYFPNLQGRELYLAGKAAALLDSQGQITGAIESVRDITDRKRAEEQLRAAHQELQLKNEQLRELNASKDKFFSIIAHDLRSPFTALLGYIELMTEQFDALQPEKLKDYLGKLRLSADRLYALLENLLTWSRIQRGVMEYRPERFSLHELVASNFSLFSSTAERKHITLLSLVAPVSEVYADYAMLHTVLRNLVSNALKFTTAGGQVSVSAQIDAQGVRIAVADTGMGMSPEAIARVFRIDAKYTTTGTAGETGTGLGLLLCHDLVRKNGGDMRIESEIGRGTTFRVTLPRECAVAHK